MKKSHLPSAAVPKFVPGKRYRGVQGKVVHLVEHRFEEGLLYIHVRFTDKTELSWRIANRMTIEESAHDYLKREHDRIRAACVKFLAQKDRHLERRLFRADLDSSRHLHEMLLYEERLSPPQRRRVLDLNRYGRKLERIMDALMSL